MSEDRIRFNAFREVSGLTEQEEVFRMKFKSLEIQKLSLTQDEAYQAIESFLRKNLDNIIEMSERDKAIHVYKEIYNKYTRADIQFPTFTAKEFRDVIIKLGERRALEKEWETPFDVDDDNRKVIDALSLYFTNDQRFCDLGDRYSLKKGIMLAGGTGTGKTELLKLCYVNPKNCFVVRDCKDITREYSKSSQDAGEAIFGKYINLVPSHSKNETMGQEYLGMFFDDFGAEGVGSHYGKKTDVMDEILWSRYKFVPYYMTHVTTNLRLDDIKQRYDDRLFSRIQQMFNVIEYPASAKDRRLI